MRWGRHWAGLGVTLILGLISNPPAFAQGNGAIVGYVLDDSTQTPLQGANVVLLGTRLGAATDRGGRFQIPGVPPGRYRLKVSFIGYETQTVKVKIVGEPQPVLRICLRRKNLLLPAVEITAAKEDFQQESLEIQPSVIRLSLRQVLHTPAAGEPDLFRALQQLPGVSSLNEASNQLYIRGGSPDQNLVTLNGIRIYNPFHLFGLAANINPDILGKVTASTGGYSARFGEAVSGVIDMESRQAEERLRAMGSLSLISSKITLSRSYRGKLQWLFSGRRTYHDFAARLVGEHLPYYFYDVFAAVNWKIAAKHSLRLTSFYSSDILQAKDNSDFPVWACDLQKQPSRPAGTAHKETRFGFPWSNAAVGLTWDYRANPRLQARAGVNFSQTRNTIRRSESIQYDLQPGVEVAEIDSCLANDAANLENAHNRLAAWQARLSLYWHPISGLRLHAGAEWSQLNFKYFWENLDTEGDDIVLHFDHAPENFRFQQRYAHKSGFLEAIWQPLDRLKLQPGLRVDWRSPLTQPSVDPRMSVSYRLRPGLQIKGAAGIYRQGIAYVRERGIFAVNELFFSLPFTVKAQHAIVGFSYTPSPLTRITLETYYKNFKHQPVRLSGAGDFESVDGWAYGMELALRHHNFTFIYVFSRVRHRLQGDVYDPPWDIRHRLQFSNQFHLGQNWTLSIHWEVHSGQPYSPLTISNHFPVLDFDPKTGEPFYFTLPRQVDYRQGAIRYPVYHRLDISLIKKLKRHGWSIAPYFQVLNVYNHKNPLYYEVRREPIDIAHREYRTVFKPTGVPIIPSLGVRFSF